MKLTNNDTKELIESIYNRMFLDFNEQYIIVFLCGGASKKNEKSLRDRMRTLLENQQKTVYQIPIKIFYPEDLLIEVLNKTKEADLLSYEQLLANNSHVIAIICESPGSLVELGAFTNNQYTIDKVVAAIDKKKIKDKSFIMLGPIKYLRKLNKWNVVEYGTDDSETARKLFRCIKEKNKKTIFRESLKISTIMGMHYYIQLLLYFFKQLTSKELVDIIQFTADKNRIVILEFNVIFNAALKLLFKEESIMKKNGQQYSIYQLSKSGYKSMEKIIRNCTKIQVCDKIRTDIMFLNYYKAPHS